jgi:hypothetical protein
MHQLIEEAAGFPTLRLVAFTGGECFLLGVALDAAVRRAHDLGLDTRVMTNGYWAVNRSAAAVRVRSLQQHGLDELHLSTGAQHEEFVPVERVAFAARAAAEQGLKTSIWVEERSNEAYGVERLIEPLAELVADGRVSIGRQRWGAWEDPNSVTTRGCDSVLTVLSVTPDLDLMACCGFTMESTPALRLGSVCELSISEVLAAPPDDFLKIWLHVEGPERILDFIAEHDPTFVRPAANLETCDACAYLHGDRKAQEVLAREYEPIVADTLLRFRLLMAAWRRHVSTRARVGVRTHS